MILSKKIIHITYFKSAKKNYNNMSIPSPKISPIKS